MKIDERNMNYQPAQKIFWTGRESNPNIPKQYWHQVIELGDITNLKDKSINQKEIDIAILGYACDEGVRRNLGRVGAKHGPKIIRENLAKLPIHFDSKHIVDFGDVICLEENMETCQKVFSTIISELISKHIFPIAFGGGHDIAFGHFMGIHNAIKNTSKNNIGIINFDAHFDLRPIENKSNSGTPFNQIISTLKKSNETVDYFVIGIQQQSNTKELFDIAKSKHVDYTLNYDCESSSDKIKSLQKKLIPFIAKNDYLYITIDLDGFSSAYAPGVSAPSPLGFTPYFVFDILRFLFDSNKVISCDIAELNPTYDQDNITANLAAKLVDFMAMNS